MPTYKAPDNSLHCIDSDEFEYLLPTGSLKITETEADAIRTAANPPPDPKIVALAQIDAIERNTLMNRATREFLLAIAEEKAVALGVAADQASAYLYQANAGYHKVKDVDNEIVALRGIL